MEKKRLIPYIYEVSRCKTNGDNDNTDKFLIDIHGSETCMEHCQLQFRSLVSFLIIKRLSNHCHSVRELALASVNLTKSRVEKV
jgi:acetolactate synthase small subunit